MLLLRKILSQIYDTTNIEYQYVPDLTVSILEYQSIRLEYQYAPDLTKMTSSDVTAEKKNFNEKSNFLIFNLLNFFEVQVGLILSIRKIGSRFLPISCSKKS